jgi:uncharacterized protein (DUF1778 family)
MLRYQRSDVKGGKKVRMEQRLPQEAKEIIEKAARLQGLDLSEFVVSHAVTAARETIAKMGTTALQPEDISAFMRAFEEDQPNGELAALFALHEEVMPANGDK